MIFTWFLVDLWCIKKFTNYYEKGWTQYIWIYLMCVFVMWRLLAAVQQPRAKCILTYRAVHCAAFCSQKNMIGCILANFRIFFVPNVMNTSIIKGLTVLRLLLQSYKVPWSRYSIKFLFFDINLYNVSVSVEGQLEQLAPHGPNSTKWRQISLIVRSTK